ncbi:hypothetical protein [Wolbachia endosymbiont (group A) of Tiphia femorata]|nr:hypothetical protein [Wolbachia endosymbiont (group A) of Tiphia femorata]
MFIVAVAVGALVYGTGKLYEKVSGQFSDVSTTEYDPKQSLV